MKQELYFVVTSGWEQPKGQPGTDCPRVLYAGYSNLVAETVLKLCHDTGESLKALSAKWFPCPGQELPARFFLPGEAFLIKARDNTGGHWDAIVTEAKDFEMPRDVTSYEQDGAVLAAGPTDFRPCASLPFYAVTMDRLQDILHIHRCGTMKSDHRVVYFIPDERTIRD